MTVEALEAFARFLHDYGPYATTSIFVGLYWIERKERISTQLRYEGSLQRAPREIREHSTLQTHTIVAALARFERRLDGKQNS